MGSRKRFGRLFVLLVIVTIPIAIIVRSRLIHAEAPKIVQLVKDYKAKHRMYPGSLSELNTKIKFRPMYIYDRENDEFILEYSLFVFYRRYYSSRRDRWGYLD